MIEVGRERTRPKGREITKPQKIMKPMVEKKDFLSGKPLISPDAVHKIWSNIALLPQVNEELLSGLRKVADAEGDDRQCRVAEAFMGIADYMKIYNVFCSNHPIATATVQELMGQSVQFEAFLAEKADVCVLAESRNLDLNAFLIKPVQRICKYPLFMRVGFPFPNSASESSLPVRTFYGLQLLTILHS